MDRRILFLMRTAASLALLTVAAIAAPAHAQETVASICTKYAGQVIGAVQGRPLTATCASIEGIAAFADKKEQTPLYALRELMATNATRQFTRWMTSAPLTACNRVLLTAPPHQLCTVNGAAANVALRTNGTVDRIDLQVPVRGIIGGEYRTPVGVDTWSVTGERMMLDILTLWLERIAPDNETYWAEHPFLRATLRTPFVPEPAPKVMPPI